MEKLNFERVRKHLKTLPDAKAKIRYLIEIKTECRQNTIDGDAWENLDGRKFDEKCEMEISKINKLSLLEQPPTQPKAKLRLGDYTNSQLVLIFYYFFKQNGLEPRKNIDISPIAKFIHLITGKKFKKLVNSDFYKKLREVPNFKTDKELIKDLGVIKLLFKMVQLDEIVKMIENEIGIAGIEKRNRSNKINKKEI